jgi:hypothetical protein
MRQLSTATWPATIRSLQCMFPQTTTGRDTLHVLVCRMHKIRIALSAPSQLPALLAHVALRPVIASTNRALACMLLAEHADVMMLHTRAVTSAMLMEPHSGTRRAATYADFGQKSDETLGKDMLEMSADLVLQPLRAACLRFSDFADPSQSSRNGSHAEHSARDEMLMGMERAAFYNMDTFSAGLARAQLQHAEARDHLWASLLTLATMDVLENHKTIKTVANHAIYMDVRSKIVHCSAKHDENAKCKEALFRMIYSNTDTIISLE